MAAFIVTNNDTEKTNSRVQTALGIQTLTVSDKALLTCTSLLADDKVKCKTAIIGDLTISGNLTISGDIIFINPQVWNQCFTIFQDAFICCPLTVVNSNIQDPQLGDAFCVEGSTTMTANTNTTGPGPGQLLKLDGGIVVTSGNLLELDGSSLTTGMGTHLALTNLTTGGIGLSISKKSTTMTASTRLATFSAPDEHGAAPVDNVTLVEVNGRSLEDQPTDGTVLTTFQTGLWVNSVPVVTATIGQPAAPVGALWVDGGTVFRGQAPATTGIAGTPSLGSHGHIHSAQAIPPGASFDKVDGLGVLAVSTTTDSTDTCGRIDIRGITPGPISNGLITVKYKVPYPATTTPIVVLTAGLNLVDSMASAAVAGSFSTGNVFPVVALAPLPTAFNPLTLPAENEGFAIPLTALTGNAQLLRGLINYQVIGLLDA